MSSRIVKLPSEIAEKIAAGEVVERPISVVKELVENSLDAGASKIEVFLEDGGRKLIKVSDDGCGMNPEEMRISLERHATSKLKNVDDLFAISTLGFRGEALPSMAAISNFSLKSRPKASEHISGYEIALEGGKLLHEREAGHPVGTTVEARDLFFNTPARLKFLKSPETEWGHVDDYLTAMAMAYPEVQFIAYHNGKEKLRYVQKGGLPRLSEVWGKDVIEGLYPIEEERSGLKLSGFVGHPHLSKPYSNQIYFFLNKRHIKDRLLNHAIMAGYRNYLMKDQYPMVVLYFEIEPHLVDVNVHPTKREVRFVQPNAIHQFVSNALQKRLSEAPWARKEQIANNASTSSARTENGIGSHAQSPMGVFNEMKRGGEPFILSPSKDQGGINWFQQNYQPRQEQIQEAKSEVQVGKLPFNSLQVIGQLKNTYILCETGEFFVLVDQHAAHERIGYEKLRQAHYAGGIASQALLVPELLAMKEAEKELLLKHREGLEKLGLALDDFGEGSLVVKSLPALLGKIDIKALVTDILEELKAHDRSAKLEERLDEIFATMSCHRQIRAGDRLTAPEMQELINQLDEDAKNYHCPHGRPVMVQIPYREIEKWFKRVL